MLLAGVVCLLTGVAYYRLTQDTAEGSFAELKMRKKQAAAGNTSANFLAACADPRTWALAAVYGACFGIELTIDNIAVLYFTDHFGLGLVAAGWCAGLFGAMNLFARALGGIVSDRVALHFGLQARVLWLFVALLGEGIMLIMFARAGSLVLAIPLLMLFGLFVKMSNGATYSVVPFLNRGGLGSVSGIVGAGGNVAAVAAGFLLKDAEDWSQSLMWLGVCVASASWLALTVRLTERTATELVEIKPTVDVAFSTTT